MNYASLQRLFLLASIIFLLSPLVLQAQNTFELNDISIKVEPPLEQISLTFEETFFEPPVIDFEQGLFYVFLKNTQSRIPTNRITLPPNSQLIKNVRVTQSEHSVLLEFILKHSELLAENQLKLTQTGKTLSININAEQLLAQLDQPQETINYDQVTQEVKERLFGSSEADTQTLTETDVLAEEDFYVTSGEEALPENWTLTVLMLVGSLLLIFFILYLVLYIYNRFLVSHLPGGSSKMQVRVVAQHHISPKHKVMVLDIGGTQVACGVTPTHINFLSKVDSGFDPASFGAAFTTANTSIANNPSKQDQLRAEFLKTIEDRPPEKSPTLPKRSEKTSRRSTMPTQDKKSESSRVQAEDLSLKNDPAMEQFAKNLTKKLKSMKPIN